MSRLLQMYMNCKTKMLSAPLLMHVLLIQFLIQVPIPPVIAAGVTDAISEFYARDVNEGQVAFMWLGEGRSEFAGAASAGVMIKTIKHTVIIDPSNILQGDAIRALQFLDLILITHEHGDHFDTDSTVAIEKQTEATAIVSAGVFLSLQKSIAKDKLIQMLPDDVRNVNDITVRAIAAKHPGDRPVMYLISMDGQHIPWLRFWFRR